MTRMRRGIEAGSKRCPAASPCRDAVCGVGRPRILTPLFVSILIVLASVLAAGFLCVPTHAYADEDASAAPASDAAAPRDASGTPLSPSAANLERDSQVTVSAEADAAVMSVAREGIASFSRQNKGTNRDIDGRYLGYRYAMAGSDAFSVIATDTSAIVYIPANVASDLGIDVNDPVFQEEFLVTLRALDDAASKGGPTLAGADRRFYFTSSESVSAGDYTYRFVVEGEEGRFYATCTLEGSQDGSAGAVYAESGFLTDANDVAVTQKAEGFAALKQFLADLDWSPLWVSLKTTGVAVIVIFFLGLLAAWATLRVSDRFKGIFDTVFTIPMVLPPTVCGFLLMLFFGTSTAVGRWFIAHGIDLVFTWPAAVIACIVVGFPLMYRTARGAFENLDGDMLDAARTLGWGEGKIFLRLMLPLAWPSIAAGTVLAFARAMGEFGATLFFAGNYVGITQTIPIAIYYDWMAGRNDVAIFWVIVVILISFLVILFINVYSSHTQTYRRKGAGRES